VNIIWKLLTSFKFDNCYLIIYFVVNYVICSYYFL